MKRAKSFVSGILVIVLILSGAGMVSAASGQSTGGNGLQEMTQDRIQDPLQDQVKDQDQLREQDQLRDQDQLQDQDRLQEQDRIRDQLGMQGADLTEVMNRFRSVEQLHQALKSELNAYHQYLMLEVEGSDSTGNADAAKKIQEMRLELNRIQLELRDRIRSEYSNEELQAMETVRNRLMTQYGEAQVLKPDAIVPVGWEMHFDTPPVIRDGRVLVPVRAFSEGLGAQVAWNPENHQVTITRGATIITLTQGSTGGTVNGKVIALETSAEFAGNRLYVPLRFVSEVLGCQVAWDPDAQMAVITE